MYSFFYCFSNPESFSFRVIRKLSWYLLPEETFLKLMFWLRMGRKLDLKDPKTYNEKLQWLKLFNRKPEYHKMVEKYDAKQYVASVIGEKYIIPTYGVWDKTEDIDWDKLPDQFVIKTTNGGGGNGVLVCKNKKSFDKLFAIKQLNIGLKSDLFKYNREWPYKGIPHRIIAEAYLDEGNGVDLHDYKVMCFNGVPKLIEYHSNRHSDHHRQDFYDTEWNKTSIIQGGYSSYSKKADPKPDCLDEMIELSGKLSKNIPHCRIDWYIVKSHLYFGEITFFDSSGYDPFQDPNDDLLLGSWIHLPEKTI